MLRRGSHSVWECRYHLVWATWRRKKALTDRHVRECCEALLRRIADEYGMYVQALEVDVDHVHLFLEIPPQLSVGRATAVLKSVSAKMMFKRFPGLKQKFWSQKMWGASYFVRSVGEGVTAEMVKRYIEMHEEKAELGPAQAELFVRVKRGK
jgi:putative transposase